MGDLFLDGSALTSGVGAKCNVADVPGQVNVRPYRAGDGMLVSSADIGSPWSNDSIELLLESYAKQGFPHPKGDPSTLRRWAGIVAAYYDLLRQQLAELKRVEGDSRPGLVLRAGRQHYSMKKKAAAKVRPNYLCLLLLFI